MNGGYLMVSKSDTNLYTKLNNALTVGKPILWYEDANTCYYIDTITKSGSNIVLTKGGKTITVEDDGDITEVGDVLTIMENIVDADGNKRFTEGEIDVINSNVTPTYNKWSLSGTHFMVALAGKITPSTLNEPIAEINVPSYIFNKIYPLINKLIERRSFQFYDDNGVLVSTTISYRKETTNLALSVDNQTFTADTNFRIQFDLLIDAE